MLNYFVALAACASITRDNSTIFLGEMNHGPVFVSLTSQYCPHCQEMMPIWKQLEEKYEGSKSVLIATIDCDTEKKLCSAFPDNFTPVFYWVRTTPERAEQFTGAVKLNEFVSFVEKQISPSVIEIGSEETLKSEITKNNESSIFMMQNLDEKQLSDVLHVASKYINFPCHFFKLGYQKFETKDPVFLNMYSPTNRTIMYSGDYSLLSIGKFIEKLAYPPISHISKQFFEHAEETNSTVLILADELPRFETILMNLTGQMDPYLRAGVIFCGNTPGMCHRLVIPIGRGSQLIMYNPTLKYIWYFRGNLTNTSSIISWSNDVLNWRVRASGPGAGFAGFIGNMFDNAMSGGYAGFVMIIGAAFVLLLVFLAGIAQTISNRDRMNGYSKLD